PLKIYVHFDKVLSRKITVNLVDQTPPVIEQKKPLQIAYGTKINWMGYVHILDNVDKTIPVTKSQISRVDTKKVGKQKVTIKVKDKANNVTKKEFEVEVIPKAPNKTTTPSQIQHDSVNRASAPQTAKTGEQFQKADQISNTAEKREIPNTSKLKSALQFNGLTVPYRQMQGASSAPETGAATWNGTGLVNDGAPDSFYWP
ncbi:bacterial Ig-like domain-containing protein, partial [Enterococcus sp.]